MSNHDEKDLLAHELRQRSAGVGGHPIGLDDVRDRARSIRRRRNAVRGVVAAVVLAVAVPVGLSATDLLGSSGTPAPPVASQSGEPSPDTPAPTPGPDGSFPLTVHGLPQGEPAGVPYVVAKDDQLVTPDSTLDLPESYATITPYNGGWLAIGSEQHPGKIIMLDDNLEVTHTDPAGGYDLAVSADRSHVAYVVAEGNDKVMLVNAPTDGTDPVTWMIDSPGGEAVNPVGYLDNDTVVYNAPATDVMGIARTGGTLTPVEGLLRIDDASEATGMISGLISYGTAGGCSGVMDPESGKVLWKSCDYSNLPVQPGRPAGGGGRVVLRRARLADADHPGRQHRRRGRRLLARAARHRGRRHPGGVGGRRHRAGARRGGRGPGDGPARGRRVVRARHRRGAGALHERRALVRRAPPPLSSGRAVQASPWRGVGRTTARLSRAAR